jgi:DNA-binding NarL/FixJ family response regulator
VGGKLRIVIADDHRLVLEGVRRSLAESPGIEIVGEADSGAAVLPLVARVQPDLVLMDLRMPRMNGLACLDQLREKHPNVRVIIFSASNEDTNVQAALKRGASGYMLKSVDPADLASAIRAVAEGTVYCAHATAERDPADVGRSIGLTDRETEILKALARGMTTQAIGRELWVSVPTVKFHLRNLYRKLGVKNRTCAARWAYDNGLVSPLGSPEAVGSQH